MTKLRTESLFKDRDPIILRNSAYVIYHSLISPGYNDSVIRAANLIYSSLRFFESLRHNKLNIDLSSNPRPSFISSRIFDRFINLLPSLCATYGAYLFGVFPLDISSYHHLFQSSLIPSFDMDRLNKFSDSRHIVVINQGAFYFFDVFDHQGRMISCEQLVSNLVFIRSLPRSRTHKPSLGLITTMNRDDAAKARNRLSRLDGHAEGLNTRNLQLLDSAILTLVISDEASKDLSLQVSSALTNPNGSQWFDKTFSLLVNQNGDSALNVVDGLIPSSAILRFANSIYNDAETRPIADPWILESPQRLPRAMVRRMEWHLDDAFYEELLLPQSDLYESQRADIQVACLDEEGKLTISNRLCNRVGVSSDAMMQIAFLMAYARIHGKYGFKGGSTEVCSTRSFCGGGEALARPLTAEVRGFLDMVLSEKILGWTDENDLLESLKQCSRAHQKVIREASAGHDWDSHLFALHQIAESSGKGLASIFAEDAYQRIKSVDLRTSPLRSDCASACHLKGVLAGARLPSSHGGYGIVYAINDDGCSACITTRRESGSYSKALEFAEAARKSLRQLAKILQS
nr:carnitine O palmitoyltransferase 2 [Hymenolepis microstoma]